jgi:hypothetical protein
VTEETKTETKEEKGEIVYPDTFAVGFGKSDITPTPPIAIYGGVARGVHDRIYLNCVAVWDGEKTALIMTADLKKMLDEVALKSLDIIEKKFKIPAENVILSCTHTHSAPDAGESGEGNDLWLRKYYQQLPVAIENALRDLAPVKGAFEGKSEMEEGITFVRRYLMSDGKYEFNPQDYSRVVEHESQPDREMRTVRFEREGKKDVLLVNFQTHYGGADRKYANQISADFFAPFRELAAEKFNCEVAYYSGAGGGPLILQGVNIVCRFLVRVYCEHCLNGTTFYICGEDSLYAYLLFGVQTAYFSTVGRAVVTCAECTLACNIVTA